MTFEPKVWDKYSPVYDQLPIERNALVASTGETIFMDGYEFEFEDFAEDLFLPGFACCPTSYVELGTFPVPVYTTPLPVPNKYYLYSISSIAYGNGFGWMVHRVYRREIAYAPTGFTPPGFVTNGVIAEETIPGVSGIWKWVRPVGDMVYTTYTYVENGDDIYEELELPPVGIMIGFNGCITLKSILEYFATFFNLTYVSDFFDDSPCPMGGTSLTLTMVQQISNLRDTADAATKGMMKLEDLLGWIRDTFNAYWYIDSVGDWRFEHRKYFDYGLSYTYTHVIELDLNLYPENILHLNKYEWESLNFLDLRNLIFLILIIQIGSKLK